MIGYKVPPVFASNDTRRIIQTFTRPSDAYLDGTLYGPDVARYPSNSGIRGALVEEGASNLVDQTLLGPRGTGVGMTNAGDTYNGESVKRITMGGTLSDDWGLTSGTRTGATAGTVYTMSADVRSVSGGSTIKFTLMFRDAGGVLIGTSPVSPAIPITSTLARYSYTYAAAPANTAQITAVVNGATANQIFDAVSLDVQAKAYATSHAAPTRAAETLTVPTAGLLVPQAGSVIIRGYWDAVTASATSSTRRLFDHTGAGNINQMILFKSGANFSVQTGNGSGTLTTINWASTFTEGWHTAGVRFGGGAVSLWADGGATAKAQNLAANLPAAFDPTMKIGSGSAGNQQWNNGIAFIYFYNRALSDAEMAAATAGNPPPDFTAYLDYTGGTLRSALRVLNRNFNPDLIAPAGNTFG